MAQDSSTSQTSTLPDAFTQGPEPQAYQPGDAQHQPFDTHLFESVRNLVIAKVAQIDEIKSKISEHQDSLKNIFVNDQQLQDAEAKAKDSKVIAQKRKQTLKESPEAMALEVKMKELKEDMKDIQDSLSNQLIQLYQLTGVQEFETPEGDVREFTITGRIKGKKAK